MSIHLLVLQMLKNYKLNKCKQFVPGNNQNCYWCFFIKRSSTLSDNIGSYTSSEAVSLELQTLSISIYCDSGTLHLYVWMTQVQRAMYNITDRRIPLKIGECGKKSMTEMSAVNKKFKSTYRAQRGIYSFKSGDETLSRSCFCHIGMQSIRPPTHTDSFFWRSKAPKGFCVKTTKASRLQPLK